MPVLLFPPKNMTAQLSSLTIITISPTIFAKFVPNSFAFVCLFFFFFFLFGYVLLMYDTNVLFLSEGYVLNSIIESTIFVNGVYILFIG